MNRHKRFEGVRLSSSQPQPIGLSQTHKIEWSCDDAVRREDIAVDVWRCNRRCQPAQYVIANDTVVRP